MTVLSISADMMTELQRETLADATMQKLAKFIKEGWPGHERSVPPDVKPFSPFRDELVIENDVILKGQKGSGAQIFAQGPHGCGPHQTACQRCGLLAKRCDKTSRVLFLSVLHATLLVN